MSSERRCLFGLSWSVCSRPAHVIVSVAIVVAKIFVIFTCPAPSFLRRQESSCLFWVPAFAGTTAVCLVANLPGKRPFFGKRCNQSPARNFRPTVFRKSEKVREAPLVALQPRRVTSGPPTRGYGVSRANSRSAAEQFAKTNEVFGEGVRGNPFLPKKGVPSANFPENALPSFAPLSCCLARCGDQQLK